MDKLPTLFISYHGTNEGLCASSLDLAKHIKSLLVGKVDVYLYADDRQESFYKDNKDALKRCQNLLLVAVDKIGLESKWVESEVDNFDAMIKNGLKPNGKIFAITDDKCTHKDLIAFNPIFAGKDCLTKDSFDADHFVSLISKNEPINESLTLDLSPERIVSKEITFKNPFNFGRLEGIFNELDIDYINRNLMSDYSLVAYSIIKDLLSKYNNTVFVFKVNNPDDFLSYFCYQVNDTNLVILIGSELDERVVISKNKVIGKIDKINFRNGKSLCLNQPDESSVSIQIDNCELLSFSSYSEAKFETSLGYDCYDLKTDNKELLTLGNNYSSLVKFINYSHYNSFLFKSLDEETRNQVCKNFSTYKIRFPVPSEGFLKEEVLYKNLEDELYLHDESILAKYLYSIKTKTEKQELLSMLIDPDDVYSKICKNLKSFYHHNQTNLLFESISLLLEVANRHDYFSLKRHNSALRIVAKLYINNIFIFSGDYERTDEILNFLEYERKFAIMPLAHFQISTYLAVLHKEYVFNGRYQDVDKQLASEKLDGNAFLERAFNKVINEIDVLVEEEKEFLKTHPNNVALINVIAFGVRHRCVMYERSGDNETNATRQKEKYAKWASDAKEVMNMDAAYPGIIDKEIVGCARQNFVYADMRLNSEKDKADYMLSIVKEAEKTKEIMFNASSQRVFVYSEIQIAEAYTELLKILNFNKDEAVFAEAIESIIENASAAYEIIQNTTDDLATAWINKFFFVGFVCDGMLRNEPNSVAEGLKHCGEAMKICEEKTFIHEATYIIDLFSRLLDFIYASDLVNEEINLILKDDLIAETKMLMKVIDFINLDETNLIELQKNIALTLRGIMSDD